MDSKDRNRFDNSLRRLLFARNGAFNIDTGSLGGYWSICKGYDWKTVSGAMTKALKGSGHLSASDLANLCKPSQTDRALADAQQARDNTARQTEADRQTQVSGRARFGAIWLDPEFQSMKAVANLAYSKRCIPGHSAMPDVSARYDGEFDYQYIVDAAALPTGASVQQTEDAFEVFWRLLREEWELFIGKDKLAELTSFR